MVSDTHPHDIELFEYVEGELPAARRDEIAEALTAAGIACASYYVTPTHLQPAMGYLGVRDGSLPETERAAAENLALPMWGGIDREQQERVVDAVRAVAGVPA